MSNFSFFSLNHFLKNITFLFSGKLGKSDMESIAELEHLEILRSLNYNLVVIHFFMSDMSKHYDLYKKKLNDLPFTLIHQ